MRLAWFTPWSPQTGGPAGDSAFLVPRLAAAGHAIDVFVDERVVPIATAYDDAPPVANAVRVQSAHDFVWRAARGQYDLVVYQVGNSHAHEFIWPYLTRWPGLAVLHDARLHHARGRAYLSKRRADAYRFEFARNHPDVSRDAGELAVWGFDGAYYYLWPMTGSIVAASRFVAVHTVGGAADLQHEWPDRPAAYLPIRGGTEQPVAPADRELARAGLGVSADTLLFGVFGALTAEKRVPQVLHAFRVIRAHDARARLLLAGRPDAALGLHDLAVELGIEDDIIWRDALDDEAFEQAIAAVDVTINLRWPSAVETSGPWVRALAAGRPTVIVDLPHQSHIPALDPRTWQPWDTGDPRDPVTIAIDILDEDHSLRLALRRLASDAPLRERVGHAARAYWEREHAATRVLDAYESVLARAAAAPIPPALAMPADVNPADVLVTSLLVPFGDLSCELF